MRSFGWLIGIILGLSWAADISAQNPFQSNMVSIPEGPFFMGRDDGPQDEKPSHRLQLRLFSIDRTPVTNRQFAAFLNVTGALNPTGERLYDADDNDARVHKIRDRWL